MDLPTPISCTWVRTFAWIRDHTREGGIRKGSAFFTIPIHHGRRFEQLSLYREYGFALPKTFFSNAQYRSLH